MEKKIDLEIRLREFASRALLEARTEIDVLEVEKSLLASDQRMNCYALELEQQRKRFSNVSLGTNSDSGRGSKASVSGHQNHRPTAAAAAAAATTTTATTTPTTTTRTKQPLRRSDVIGDSATPTSSYGKVDATRPQTSDTETTESPSGFSLSSSSKSCHSSPSKLSPVSGPSPSQETDDSATSTAAQNRDEIRMSSRSSSIDQQQQQQQQQQQEDQQSSRSHRRRSNNQVVRQPTGGAGNNTLNRNRSGAGGVGQQHKLQKQRQRERLAQFITRQSNINCLMTIDNKSTLSLSELRIPLMWRDVDHFKGRGDYRRYAVFCLLKIGAQIYDTKLISDVDRQATDLTFDDLIVFQNVEHDFELELEVYSCAYLEQFSLSSTPRKLKEKLSNSVSRAMGRRLATQTASVNYTKELEAYESKSYRFALIASAKLTLFDASDTTKTYDLSLISPEAHGRHHLNHHSFGGGGGSISSQTNLWYHNNNNNNHSRMSSMSTGGGLVASSPGNQKDLHKNTLPLFGHFCCQLQVRPDVFDKCVKSGYLKVAPINIPDSIGQQQHQQQDILNKSLPISSNLDDLNNDNHHHHHQQQQQSQSAQSTMLRSALAASSKLASISMSNSSTVHWAMLRNFTLNLWQVDEQKLQLAMKRGHAPQVDISRKQPLRVNIDKFARLLRVSNSSLTIETDKGCFVLAIYNQPNLHPSTSDELGEWLRSIEQMIYDSHIWGSVINHYPPNQIREQQKQALLSPKLSNTKLATATDDQRYYSQYNSAIEQM